jgi:hypothetical protein
MNRLIKPPLFEEIKKYLNTADKNKQIFLFVPYIQTNYLEKLIDGLQNKIIIVTNWSKENLKSTSSELKLYPFCKSHGISLYNNENIHLKIYSINLESMILATGNISKRGLMPNGNIELATLISEITPDDRLFFEKIRYESTLITDEIFAEFEKWQELNPPDPPKNEPFPEILKKEFKKEFMIDALPMTRDIKILQRAYDRINSGLKPSDDEEITDCVYHDLVKYEIPSNLSQEKFLETLSDHFFDHPFIQRIDQFLKPCGQFGAIKEWIQINCTDVPIPSRRELTGNVQVLLEWFVELGDGKYRMDVPGARSQRLCNLQYDPNQNPLSNDNMSAQTAIAKYTPPIEKILEEEGYTIPQIQDQYDKLPRHRTIHEPDDTSQEKYYHEPIWHSKSEIDKRVEQILGLDSSVLNEKLPNGRKKFGIDTGHVISNLNKEKKLIVWYNDGEGGDGIWRLKEITPIVTQENPISQFKIGQFYHHKKIFQTISGIGAGGGIRPGRYFPIIVVFRRIQKKDEENVYDDKYDEKTGIFHYNARGSGGAEQLEISQNQEIVNAKENGKTIIFFNQHEYGGEYEYLGEVELVGTTTEKQLDNGKYVEKLILLLKPVEKQSVQNTLQKNDLDTKLVLFSAAGDAAFEHFENTVLNDVSTSKFGNSKMKEFSNVRMWGANDRSTNQNRSKWSKLKKGDILLFFRDKKYVAKMVLEGTEDNYEIAKMIWGEKIDHKTMNVQSKKGETWQLIMYALPENATKIDLDHFDLNKLVGYKETFLPTRTLDFMPVRKELRKDLERKYGSIQKALESIGI